MQMAEGLDTGGVLSAWETAIGSDETAGRLSERLAVGAAELLGRTLMAAAAGRLVLVPQDEGLVTRAPRLTKEDARLDFDRPASQIARAIRAFSPRPGAFTTWREERFKIHRARVVPGNLEPGRLDTGGGSLRVGAGYGCIEPLTVQPANARSMEAHEWLRGVKGDPGRFE